MLVVLLLNQFAQTSSLSTVISFQETFSEKCTFNSGLLLLSAVCLCPNEGNNVSVSKRRCEYVSY